jgi:hypothetical protein
MLHGFMAANDKFAQQVNPPTRPNLLFKDAARSQVLAQTSLDPVIGV